MGLEIPPAIAATLQITKPWMAFYIQAYVDLSTDVGERGYIKWRAIDAYARRYGFDGWGFEWFKRCIRAIEDHVLAKRAQAKGAQADAAQQPERVKP